jgi:hypothetical protein
VLRIFKEARVLLPAFLRYLDHALMTRSKDPLLWCGGNGVASGEGSKGGENERLLAKPKARRSKRAPGPFLYLNDGVEMSANGWTFRCVLGIMEDLQAINLKSGDTFKLVSLKGPAVVVSADESETCWAFLDPRIQRINEFWRNS